MYLLDTDTIIYWLKGNRTVSARILQAGYRNIGASAITRAELYYGAFKSEKVDMNLRTIETLSDRIQFHDFSKPCQKKFAQIKVDLDRQGQPIDDFDPIIAATAMTSGFTLVTNNTQHFNRIPDLLLENWAV